jgi:nitroreductase
MDTYDAIAKRTSVYQYRPDPVPRYVVERLIAAAIRAPNHKLTEPWRFAVLTGESKRRYAELRRGYRASRFDDPASPEAQRAAEKAYREPVETPALVVVMCKVADDPVRREEDYGAAMMAIQNLMLAATADGLGSVVRTGGIMDDPALRALVGVPEGYRVVGIVSIGYLLAEPEPTPRRISAAEVTRWLD